MVPQKKMLQTPLTHPAVTVTKLLASFTHCAPAIYRTHQTHSSLLIGRKLPPTWPSSHTGRDTTETQEQQRQVLPSAFRVMNQPNVTLGSNEGTNELNECVLSEAMLDMAIPELEGFLRLQNGHGEAEPNPFQDQHETFDICAICRITLTQRLEERWINPMLAVTISM